MKMLKFETAALAEAVKRAAAIAPTKGAAFDQASGIHISSLAGARTARMCSTDLQLYFSERVNVLDSGDEDVSWRIPSDAFNSITSNLPMGAGQAVEVTDEGSHIVFKCGRRKARLRTSDPFNYPKWEEFDTAGMGSVPDFAQRVAQVGWAAEKGAARPVLAGVHLDGQRAIATDASKIAIVPCEFPIQNPITVALAPLSQIVRPGQESMVRATDRQLEIVIDEYVQVSALLIAGEYPKVDKILDQVRAGISNTATVDRTRFAELITHMVALTSGRDRLPNLRVILSENEMTLRLTARDVGDIEDTFDVVYSGPDFFFDITPQNLKQSLENGVLATVEFAMQSNPTKPMILSHLGYEVVVMPRNLAKAEAAKAAAAKAKEEYSGQS